MWKTLWSGPKVTSFLHSCGSVVVDTELLFDSTSDMNEAMVNTILEQSADEFLTYNLTLLDPGLVESMYCIQDFCNECKVELNRHSSVGRVFTYGAAQ